MLIGYGGHACQLKVITNTGKRFTLIP